MNADETETGFRTEEFKKTLNLLKQIGESGRTQLTREQMRQSYVSGTVAMTVDSSSSLKSFQAQAGFEVATARLPLPAGDAGRVPAAGVASDIFRSELQAAGFQLLPGETPIIQIMTYEAELAKRLASALDKRGVFVADFSHPVVPKGHARIRTQMSSSLSISDLELVLDAFVKSGKLSGLLPS